MKRFICMVATAMAMSVHAGERTKYVRPEIGTEFNGHTTVAAAYPFGLVQAGPDTGHGTWDYCSGYRYADKAIYGFSHTHLSGTGCPDLGDIRIVPGGVNKAYEFDKTTEVIRPGYYEVTLKEVDVRVRVTVAPHSAIYEFTYLSDAPAKLLIDTQWMLTHKDNLVKCVERSELMPAESYPFRNFFEGWEQEKPGFRIVGSRVTKGWARRRLSFAIETDRAWTMSRLPFEDLGERGGRYVLSFADVKKGDTVKLKIGLSASGMPYLAQRNLVSEIPEWDFDAVLKAADAEWEEKLALMEAEGSEGELISFYTSLYHLFFQPNNIADVGEAPYYSTFSTWDTFRAAHPLYTILTPQMVQPFVDSMIKDAKKRGFASIWTLWGEDTQCMIGTHSVPVIVDAVMKGLWRGELADAFDVVRRSVNQNHGRQKGDFKMLEKYGYYPFDYIVGESVSRTLECAYDDWCVARLAAVVGDKNEMRHYQKRAANWKNVFDPSTGTVRGKNSKGEWRTPFNPFALGHGATTANDFTEGNAYQYTWHVMQDPEGLIEAMGGKSKFAEKLEALFNLPSKAEGQGSVSDVTGLIGQYAHGNEPSHHVIYFFQYAGRPDLTAKYVNRVFDEFYMPKVDGLCGNDDCGQMSAWYLFSAMGFYPFNPCGGEYVIGAPQFRKITVKTSSSRPLVVTAKGLDKDHRYVKKVTLNGKELDGFIIKHSEIMQGGELVFEMDGKPE